VVSDWGSVAPVRQKMSDVHVVGPFHVGVRFMKSKHYDEIIRNRDKKIQELQDEIKKLEEYIKVLEKAV